MSNANDTIRSIIELNTRLFVNSFKNTTEIMAQKRPNDNTNSMMFIACHLLDARYFMARMLGLRIVNPYKQLFDRARNIDDMTEYPQLQEILSVWNELAPTIMNEISKPSNKRLQKEAPIPFPMEDKTVQGGITFLVAHESYHIGQLGFLRKYFSLESMAYD